MTTSDPLTVLAASTDRLAAVVDSLDADTLRRPAYPSEWTIAQVLSHLGSGAVLAQARLEAALTGRSLDPTESQRVWDTWDAKSPDDQAADALRADSTLLRRLEAVTGAERSTFRTSLGPMELDFDTFVGLRLNEHVLHTWDIVVALQPESTLPADAAAAVIDNLELVAGFAGRPTGTLATITVGTTEPRRRFRIDLHADRVAVTAQAQAGSGDITMPAEAFIRLVYGRLDPAHTPTIDGDPTHLEELRRAFPGI